MKLTYAAPRIVSEKSFETSALSCAKAVGSGATGSWHFSSAYDTFTGHLGPGFGASESVSGSAGVGFGPGGTSLSYAYVGMCVTWILWQS